MVLGMNIGRGIPISLVVSLRLESDKLKQAGLLESVDRDASKDIWIKPNLKIHKKLEEKGYEVFENTQEEQ